MFPKPVGQLPATAGSIHPAVAEFARIRHDTRKSSQNSHEFCYKNAACSGFVGNLKLNVISGNSTTTRSTADRAALAMHTIAVLGSTGSIGTNCLDVIGALPERLNLQGLAARTSWQLLGQQTERFAPRWAVLRARQTWASLCSLSRGTGSPA